MAERGAYAKGVAKREEILAAALTIIGEQGFRRASVREIAEAVGLSPAGLLHYFGLKEQLFVAILGCVYGCPGTCCQSPPRESLTPDAANLAPTSQETPNTDGRLQP